MNTKCDILEEKSSLNANNEPACIEPTSIEPTSIEYTDSTIDKVISLKNYPKSLSFLSDNSYVKHYNKLRFDYIQNDVVPYLTQWNYLPKDFYYNVTIHLFGIYYELEDVYYAIGVYLTYANKQPLDIEKDMNYVRRAILLIYQNQADKAKKIMSENKKNISNKICIKLSNDYILTHEIDPTIGTSNSMLEIYQTLKNTFGKDIADKFEQLETSKQTISKKGLNNIPVCEFDKISEKIKEKNTTCSICQTNFDSDDSVRQLKCYHLFHVDCVDKWLLENSSKCPNCNNIV
jgi:hypothetical protein